MSKDRDQIISILKTHGAGHDLTHHLEGEGEFVMHYLVFPLRVGIVVQPGNEKWVSPTEIQHGVDILNAGLTDTWIQFKIVAVDTIFTNETITTFAENDYQNYYDFSKKHDWRDITSLYLLDNKEVLCENFSCARTAGFANILETATNNVVIDKFFLNDRKVVLHEFGHYFGLLHTADTRFGIEKVDGTNCETAGDRVCDTPADPGELYNVYVNYTTCRMAGFKEAGTGLEYRPLINNYMSYYAPCYFRKFQFTQGQMEVIFRAAIWIRQNQIIELGELPLAPWGL